MDRSVLETNSETFSKVMGLKLQQKKLWNQIETFTKVMRPKVHFSLKKKETETCCEEQRNTHL